MSIAEFNEKPKPAFLMLVLLLISLWLSAGHLHAPDDADSRTHCAICIQLQSAEHADAPDAWIEALPPSARGHATATNPCVHSPVCAHYQSRAPPRHFSLPA